MSQIAELDAAGFMPVPGESEEMFVSRVRGILDRHAQFDALLAENKTLTVFGEITVEEREKIPPEIIARAADVTWELYKFRTSHVPGFFLSRSVGLLWGGCLIGDPDENFSLFLIRNAFRTREKWLFYRRTELFAHELCHSMRLELRETTLEEHFAYQTSPSALRRYLGNCFIRDVDAVLFVVPALLLLAATLVRDFFWGAMPVGPFWILVFVYPLFLLLRNAASRRVVKKAARKLNEFGITETDAILFRCTREELCALGALENREQFDRLILDLGSRELRWKIIIERFITRENTTV